MCRLHMADVSLGPSTHTCQHSRDARPAWYSASRPRSVLPMRLRVRGPRPTRERAFPGRPPRSRGLAFRRRKDGQSEQLLRPSAQRMRRTGWNRNEVARLDLAFLAGDAAGRFSFDHVDELVAAMGVLVVIAEAGGNRKYHGFGLRRFAEDLLGHLRAVPAMCKDIWNGIVSVPARSEFIHLPRKEFF